MTAALFALIGAVVAPVCALAGAIYGVRRASAEQARATKAENDAALAQVTQVSAVERAQAVLVETIQEMRTELKRQDEEHAGAIATLTIRHEHGLASVRSEIDQVREHHKECEVERRRLVKRVAELEAR